MNRRRFLAYFLNGSAVTFFVGSYGYFSSLLLRFFYSGKSSKLDWTFVSTVENLQRKKTIEYISPIGEAITLTVQATAAGEVSYRALSSVCPHLGCQVFWQSANKQFFCPCHNGVFDSSGQALSGPPAQANQKLLEYPMKIKMGLVFVQVPTEKLASQRTENKQCRIKA